MLMMCWLEIQAVERNFLDEDGASSASGACASSYLSTNPLCSRRVQNSLILKALSPFLNRFIYDAFTVLANKATIDVCKKYRPSNLASYRSVCNIQHWVAAHVCLMPGKF